MQAILKSISHPELGDVVIDDSLINVGREGDAFAKLPLVCTGRLSRRHARLFQQDGEFYIVDLSSRNGTFVNGEPVTAQPRALRSGDMIDFAGELTYRLDVDGASGTRANVAPGKVTLQLVATRAVDGPESLVISAFPFLISKRAEAFAKYEERVPHEVNYLSRRHAHIFSNDGHLLLEDLGSTNGTFVDGERLTDTPVELHDGQTVAFGGEFFVYRVMLIADNGATRVLSAVAPAPVPPVAPASPAVDCDKTTFVSAATSFLDIFCAETEAEEEAVPAASTPSSTQPGTKPRSLATQLIHAVGGSPRWLALALAGVVIAAAILIYWAASPSTSDRVQELIEQRRFDAALDLALQDATVGESGSLINRLALRSLIAKTLPDWLDALQAGRYDALAALVPPAPKENFAGGSEFLDLLRQIGEIRSTLASRGGATATLHWFDQEPRTLQELIDTWERPQPDKRLVSERVLAAIAPDQADLARRFSEAYRRTASQARTLASRLAVYWPAQQQMTDMLNHHIVAGSLARLDAELDQLAARFSQFGGVQGLKEDLAQYRAIVEAMAAQRELDVTRQLASVRFHAPPFTEAAARLANDRLPSAEFLVDYDAAMAEWQQGRADAALARLATLQSSPWRSVAERETARMQSLLADVEALNTLRGGDEYAERLLAFYQKLDKQRDAYFVQQLATDHVEAKRLSAQAAEQALEVADDAWTTYGGRGGITSAQRLEPVVGKVFEERAAALSVAADAVDRAAHAYALADLSVPGHKRGLVDAIANEVALQHQSLDELQGVLDDDLLRSKRALLPQRKW